MNFLITGALGFIGSNFVNFYLDKHPNVKIIVLDKCDYCSSHLNITNLSVKIIVGDILDDKLVKKILYEEHIDTIIHFAAESHVDNSFNNSLAFTKNNVLGTHTLLEEARLYNKDTNKIRQFIHVSTDEVYGEVKNNEMRTEKFILDATNPYAATKVGAESLAISYFKSYNLPVIVTRANNVYGQNQYPEKIIPKFICQLLEKKPVTIHGTGLARRNFIHVYDVCSAYETIINCGVNGEIYNISAAPNSEFGVLEIAQMLIKLTGSEENAISYVVDRNFNDCRYYTSSQKLELLGWKPVKVNFEENLAELVEWYRINKSRYLS
jgi:dTDP-glucose 4,6-dehydratase